MGLIDLVRRAAFVRPRLLVVAAPGATELRIALERFTRLRGWALAGSPADADVLVEAGVLLGGLAEVSDTVWRQLPAPSIRVALTAVAEIEPCLADLPARLASWRPEPGDTAEELPELPMADRAEDRDGLMLDVLRVPLGPLLPHWPDGLRLLTRLQGDVIQEAHPEVLGLGPGTGSFWAARQRAVAHRLDSTARLLGVAGWTAMRWRCQTLRDRALDDESRDGLAIDVETTAARIRRSRLLRSELAGLGVVAELGDATARLYQWLSDALRGLRESASGPAGSPPSAAEWLGMLPDMVVGAELSAARLIVASIGLDTASARRRPVTEVRHG